ncbi:MAG TPA: hypothetical protein VK592_05180 [Candidatus Dormibacteraeota bacterium]|nr:hypothetical protein [Candidatus Dormibacteraeota bacterium]
MRWRQLRNPPVPVVRAIVADSAVAMVGGLLLLLYDLALSRGVDLPGDDLRAAAVTVYVVVVLTVGSLLTYLWVPLPTGASGVRRRSPWSALLGLFAALPIAYLVLVLVFQIVRPLLGP